MSDWVDNLVAALAGAAFAAKCGEYQNEAFRCRQIVKAVMEKTDVNGVTVEFYTRKPIGETDSGLGIVLCAPGLDEDNLAGPATEILAWYFDRLGIPNRSWNVGKMQRLGTEADE